jgi:hypothetical protein
MLLLLKCVNVLFLTAGRQHFKSDISRKKLKCKLNG